MRLNRYRLQVLCVSLVGLVMAGCSRNSAPPAPEDPTAFVKWAMDRYASFPNMQSTAEVVTVAGNQKLGDQKRTFRYQTPNRFRVEAKGHDGSIIDAISDGTHEQDYDNLKLGNSFFNGSAPAVISEATSADMLDPSLCGSPIYGFFAGSKGFSRLVKGRVTQLGTLTTQNGELARKVRFDTPGLIGDVHAIIGTKSGFVFEINYDLSGAKEQLMKKIATLDQKNAAPQREAVAKLLKTRFYEHYLSIGVGQPLSRGAFDPNLPGASALAAVDMTKQGDDTPIPLNEPAPDFHLKALDGTPITLASLKGHPIMIDFWATWCAPCRQGLPDTAAIQAAGRKNGLVVLAVTDEDPETIQRFLSKQTYVLSACRDEKDVAQRAYVVGGLPSQVFIDSKGNVVKYLVGYHEPSDVHAALSALGIKI